MSVPTVLLGALVLVLLWLLAGGRGARRRHGSPDVNEDELEQAEEELRQLDAGATPEAAEEELDDWGPGAPS